MKKTGEILIINEELFKLYSQVSINVGIDKCYPFLQLAQSFYLEPILGTPLLDELKEQVDTNTLTEVNKALILKCAHCLSAWTDFLSGRSLGYTVTQKSIVKEHSDNSEALDKDELGFYISNLREIANQAQEVLVKYLCRCADLYPLWRPSSNCDCNKYIETEGNSNPKQANPIYFPSHPKGRLDRDCGKCGH